MASGDSLCIFYPGNSHAPSANAATFDERNSREVLDFAEGEAAHFEGVMPQIYAGGGVVVLLHYAMSTATSGDVRADTSFEAIAAGGLDIDSDSFATAVEGTDTAVPGTSGVSGVLSNAHTDGAQMDSIAAGDLFRLKVERAAITGASGDLELLAVEIREA